MTLLSARLPIDWDESASHRAIRCFSAVFANIRDLLTFQINILPFHQAPVLTTAPSPAAEIQQNKHFVLIQRHIFLRDQLPDSFASRSQSFLFRCIKEPCPETIKNSLNLFGGEVFSCFSIYSFAWDLLKRIFFHASCIKNMFKYYTERFSV